MVVFCVEGLVANASTACLFYDCTTMFFSNTSLTQFFFGFRLFKETSSEISHTGVFVKLPMVAFFELNTSKGRVGGNNNVSNVIRFSFCAAMGG